MRLLLAHIKSGWHHGKGVKYSKKRNYELSLKHYLKALDYARKTDNLGSIANELECVAINYYRLKDYDRAKLYANECLNIYKQLSEKDDSGFFDKCVDRVKELLSNIEKLN